MIRTATAVLVALLATLALSASAGGRSSIISPVKIVGTSHTHPMGENTSWVCAKIKKTSATKVRVRVSGPGANVPGEVYSDTLKGRGVKIVSYEISAPGPYRFRVTLGRTTIKKSYTVPDPPTPAKGAFTCPQG